MMRWWPTGKTSDHSRAVAADLWMGRRLRAALQLRNQLARRRRATRRVHAVACSAWYGWQGERGTSSGGRRAGAAGGCCADPATAERLSRPDSFDIDARMKALQHWGVVIRWQDTAKTEADFVRTRDRYQLTSEAQRPAGSGLEHRSRTQQGRANLAS
jgi:hypothetical protein